MTNDVLKPNDALKLNQQQLLSPILSKADTSYICSSEGLSLTRRESAKGR